MPGDLTHELTGAAGVLARLPVPDDAPTSRLFIPSCGIALLTLFGVTYATDPALYFRVLAWITNSAFPHPFIDWEWIPSAVRCWQRGVDVYVDNTCYAPFAHGRHGYSPLWLRMTFLPYGRAWVTPFGLGFAVLFFGALATLPPPRGTAAFRVTILATFSSLTAFAIERANVDLIMFLLAIAGVNCWLGGPRWRAAGYGIFILAGLLKFYPFVLLLLALRERPRAFAAIAAVTLAVLTAFGVTFHDELARIGANIPTGSPFGDMFGAIDLPYGLAMIFSASPGNPDGQAQLVFGSAAGQLAGRAGWLLLTLGAMTGAVVLQRRFRLAAALGAMPRREAGFLVAAAALICGCFFAGQSVGYRAILLLPALPGLLWAGRSLPDKAGRRWFVATGPAIVSLMWVILIQQVIVAACSANVIVYSLHWLINQLVWWFVVTVLLAVLLGFARDSEMGRLAARLTRRVFARPRDRRARPEAL